MENNSSPEIGRGICRKKELPKPWKSFYTYLNLPQPFTNGDSGKLHSEFKAVCRQGRWWQRGRMKLKDPDDGAQCKIHDDGSKEFRFREPSIGTFSILLEPKKKNGNHQADESLPPLLLKEGEINSNYRFGLKFENQGITETEIALNILSKFINTPTILSKRPSGYR